MNPELEKLINEQIVKEYFSAYLYLSMAAYFEDKNLPGFAHWMKMQNKEETFHGDKFFNYLNDRGSRVVLGAIDAPETEFDSVKAVFEKTLAHEKLVTASINNLYATAVKVNDTATQMFLQWFITEQVEEEKNVSDILARIDMVKDNPMALLMLDKELASRAEPTIPPAE